jgi:hypothetical protein
MKEENCKECKVICIECKNHRYNKDFTPEYTCYAYPIVQEDCITGGSRSWYDSCENHNEDGNCKKFEEDKQAITKNNLIKALHDYSRNCYKGDSIDTYVSQLLQGLEYGNPLRSLCYFTSENLISLEERVKKYKCQKYEN